MRGKKERERGAIIICKRWYKRAVVRGSNAGGELLLTANMAAATAGARG